MTESATAENCCFSQKRMPLKISHYKNKSCNYNCLTKGKTVALLRYNMGYNALCNIMTLNFCHYEPKNKKNALIVSGCILRSN